MAVVAHSYRIHDLVGDYAMAVEAGDRVYNLIHSELLAGYNVELDFADVQLVAPGFLSDAIGRLLADIPLADFERLLTVVNLSPLDSEGLELIVENAVEYFSDPDFAQAVDAMLERVAAGDYDR